MKINFSPTFFILFYFVSFITPCLSKSHNINDNPTWKSSVNVKSQQITINGQDNELILNLVINSKGQSTLQISCPDKEVISKNIHFITFHLGREVFDLKKQNISIRNQNLYEVILTKQQLQIFIHNLHTQDNAYIKQQNKVIKFSLKNSASNISFLLKYLHSHPIPALQIYFDNPTPSHPSSWKHIIPYKNQLLYIMGFIIFFLFFGRPTLKVLSYIYKTRRNIYRKNKALNLAIHQIERHAHILYIKRDQLLYYDEYGSLIEDKWLREAHRFIRVKIKPLLQEKKLIEYYPQLQKIILQNILNIAKSSPKKERKLIKIIKKNKIQFSRTMNPYDYEIFCAEILRKNGWEANVTSASGDQGADVIAIKKNITLIIQCKLYNKPVGNKAVQEANAAKIFYHAQYAAVVSNASYTVSARQLAQSTQIVLLHHENLPKYVKSLI